MNFVKAIIEALRDIRRIFWINKADLSAFSKSWAEALNKREREIDLKLEDFKKSQTVLKANYTKLDDKIKREFNKCSSEMRHEIMKAHGELNAILKEMWKEIDLIKERYISMQVEFTKLKKAEKPDFSEKTIAEIKNMLRRARRLQDSTEKLDNYQTNIVGQCQMYADTVKDSLSAHAKGLIAEMRGILKELH